MTMKTSTGRWMTSSISVALVTLLCAVLAGPPASALVYWTTFGGDIGRANLDGSVPVGDWISSSGVPTGITVDSNYVYWARFSGDTLGRANLNGTGASNTWISSTHVSNPNGIAVDGTYVYYANTDTDEIGRADLDGSDPDPDFITGASNPTGLVVNASHIYWSNYNSGSHTIGRASINGTGVDDDFITGCDDPSGLALDGTYVYWTNYDSSGTIGRAELDGSNVNQNFITGIVNAIALTVDANYIYWTTADDIGRANLDGSSPDATWIENVGSNTRGVAVDTIATPVILVDFSAGVIRRQVKVSWETAAEIEIAGFHIWRKAEWEEDFQQMTRRIIPSEGNPFQGASYRWMDKDIEAGCRYWYKLEAVEYSGVGAFHGPIRAVEKK
jgi:hypothetical protein